MPKTVPIIFFVVLCLSCAAGIARAETITCPDMGRPLKSLSSAIPSGQVVADYIKDMHSGSANCVYGPNDRILLSWFSSLDRDAWDDKCGQRHSASEEISVKFNKKKRWIIITSRSRLALVYIWLSSREYRQRRDEWASAGRALLQEHVARGMSCDVHEPYVPRRREEPKPQTRSQPEKPAAPAQRYPATQQGRDPAPSRTTSVPSVEKTTPQPAAQPDDVDEKIDDILERLKAQ